MIPWEKGILFRYLSNISSLLSCNCKRSARRFSLIFAPHHLRNCARSSLINCWSIVDAHWTGRTPCTYNHIALAIDLRSTHGWDRNLRSSICTTRSISAAGTSVSEVRWSCLCPRITFPATSVTTWAGGVWNWYGKTSITNRILISPHHITHHHHTFMK